MASSTLLVNKAVNSLVDTPQSIYTSPSTGKGTIVNAFTAANNSTSNKSYKAYIVTDGGSADKPQLPFKIILWDDIDLGTGIDGQVIPPGGSLYTECNAIDSVYFTVSGIET